MKRRLARGGFRHFAEHDSGTSDPMPADPECSCVDQQHETLDVSRSWPTRAGDHDWRIFAEVDLAPG